MKKLLLILMCLIFASGPAFAGFGVQEDGTGEGEAGKINVSTGLDVSVSNNTATISTSLLNNGRVAAATLSLASSSTVLTDSSLPYSVILKNVGGGGGLDSTGIGTTFPNGVTNGQSISVIITGLQSGGSWVVTPTTKTGFSSIAFDTKGDTATFLWVDSTIGWIISSNGGAVITQA